MLDDRQEAQPRSAAQVLVLIHVVRACFAVTIFMVVAMGMIVDAAAWWLLLCVAALAAAWTCLDFNEADALPQED